MRHILPPEIRTTDHQMTFQKKIGKQYLHNFFSMMMHRFNYFENIFSLSSKQNKTINNKNETQNKQNSIIQRTNKKQTTILPTKQNAHTYTPKQTKQTKNKESVLCWPAALVHGAYHWRRLLFLSPGIKCK